MHEKSLASVKVEPRQEHGQRPTSRLRSALFIPAFYPVLSPDPVTIVFT